MKLTGNTILITGGGSGIGQGLAWQFAERGNQVVVAGRRRDRLEATIAGREGMHAIELDVADQRSVEGCAGQLAEQFPALNMLVHSAGIMARQELGSAGSLAIAEQIVAINLLGTMRVVETLLPQIAGKPDAVICTISSGLGFVPMPAAPAYSASKAAVHSYTLSLRQRLKGQAQVIEIVPPAVQTGLTPGQQTRPGYLPLGDYIAQTMENFQQQPDAPENLVHMVLGLRHAERDGRVEDMLARLARL